MDFWCFLNRNNHQVVIVMAASQRARIYKYIRQHDGCTRNDIARAFGMETATVAARVNHMLEQTKVIRRGERSEWVVDKITKKLNETLWVAN